MIVRTNDNNKLLLLYLIFERARRRLRVLFTWYVNYSTVPNCRGHELYVREDVCAPVFGMERSNQNDIVELWTFSLKLGWLSGVVVNQLGMGVRVADELIFRAECYSKNFGLSYYLLSTCHKVPWVSFFNVSLYDVPCASFYVLRVSNFVLTFSFSIPDEEKKTKLNFYFHTFLGCHRRFYEDLKSLHKSLWGTTKKCEDKNLT